MFTREELSTMIRTRTELITSATHTRITLSHALNRGELTRVSKGHLLPTQTWNSLRPNDRHYVCILAHLNEYPTNILAAQSAAIAWGISSLSPPRHVQEEPEAAAEKTSSASKTPSPRTAPSCTRQRGSPPSHR